MSKKDDIQTLSPANFEIMKIIWKIGKATVNQVHEILNQEREKTIGRTSVQVQMNRLEKYGWLTHTVENRRYFYSPTHTKEKAVTDILSDIRDRIFGGSSTELVKSLFKESQVTRESIDEMRSLLESYSEGDDDEPAN